jgi:cytochrome c oxidase subunit 2
VLSALLVPALLAACSGEYPNSTFTTHTDFNRDAFHLWNVLLGWGTIVFVLVEGILIYTIFRYRRRAGGPEPEHVHGNTALEITWTLAPAVILVLIAIPTVRSIWRFQSGAPANALQVDVIGHQWWWEFRYPEFGITTANEVYLPIGRPVNFSLRTGDVIHSFWIPQLGGKRDATWVSKANHLWFTPDSIGASAFNGSCNEFCGMSHANMRFRAFTVSQADFDRWVAHQRQPAVFGAAPAAPPADAAAAAPATPAPDTTAASAAQVYAFPREQVPTHVMPQSPLPASVPFDDNLLAAGDPQRGLEIYSRSACLACHRIEGNRLSVGTIGPNLTHVGSRLTLAAGTYPNEPRYLARWIKNARALKPGVLMNTLGKDQYDPIARLTITAGGLTDQQIADIVAYLMALK